MVDKVVGRVMLTVGLMIFLALFTYQAQARTVSIFDVRQNIPLTDDAPSYRDYYVNAGFDVGIKAGMRIPIERRISLHDSFQNQSPGALVVETGTLKIIHVQEKVCVGRLVGKPTPENYPIVDIDTVMVGDTLSLQSIKTARIKMIERDIKQAAKIRVRPPVKKVRELRAAPEKRRLDFDSDGFLQSIVMPIRSTPPIVVR